MHRDSSGQKSSTSSRAHTMPRLVRTPDNNKPTGVENVEHTPSSTNLEQHSPNIWHNAIGHELGGEASYSVSSNTTARVFYMNYTQLQISRLIMTFEQMKSAGYMSCSTHTPLVPFRLYDQWSTPLSWLHWLTTTPWDKVLVQTETRPRHITLMIPGNGVVTIRGAASLTFRLKDFRGPVLTTVLADPPKGVIPYVSASVSFPVSQPRKTCPTP